VINKDVKMITNLDLYLEAIKDDYLTMVTPGNTIQEEMYQDFCEGLTYSAGSKYIKVFKDRKGGRSVHSFICLRDDAKFKKGDILMAASWNAPARNFARGNVLDKTFDRVRWTGAM
jgi:hypothetical protein